LRARAIAAIIPIISTSISVALRIAGVIELLLITAIASISNLEVSTRASTIGGTGKGNKLISLQMSVCRDFGCSSSSGGTESVKYTVDAIEADKGKLS
jgi:hypothetical protein